MLADTDCTNDSIKRPVACADANNDNTTTGPACATLLLADSALLSLQLLLSSLSKLIVLRNTTAVPCFHQLQMDRCQLPAAV
jgi:hypothetical protein